MKSIGNHASALLLIDVQQGIDGGAGSRRNNPDAETNIARLLTRWREQAGQVVHVRHDSIEPGSALRPEQPGNAIKAAARPVVGEKIFSKCVNSAFIGTGLEAWLRRRSINHLVVVGLTTDHCVSTTVRMAENLGFAVTLVSDATAAFGKTGRDGKSYDAELVHEITLLTLAGEFCEIASTSQLLES